MTISSFIVGVFLYGLLAAMLFVTFCIICLFTHKG